MGIDMKLVLLKTSPKAKAAAFAVKSFNKLRCRKLPLNLIKNVLPGWCTAFKHIKGNQPAFLAIRTLMPDAHKCPGQNMHGKSA